MGVSLKQIKYLYAIGVFKKTGGSTSFKKSDTITKDGLSLLTQKGIL